MSEPIDILKNQPHFTIIAMCMAEWTTEINSNTITLGPYICGHRWIGTVVAKTSLFKLECPKCGKQDSFASFLPAEYMDELKERGNG